MTKEEMIRLTGLKQVGTDDAAVGYGLLFGFPVKAVPGKRDLALYLYLETEPGIKEVKAINQRLKDAGMKGNLTTASAGQDENSETGSYLVATLIVKEDEAQSFYNQAIAVLERALQEEEITPPAKTCAICEQGEGDTLANYDGQFGFVHMTCLQRWASERKEALELKAQNASSIQGVIGGLIGGAVGAIPALIALNFFDFFVGILFALIPLGVYYGWKLFGGRLSVLTTVFTIVYSLLVGLVVEVVDSFLILREIFPRQNITLMDTIEAYLDPEIFMEVFLRSTLTALAFTALGIFFAWRMITKTDKHEIEDNQAAVDEAIPLTQLRDR